MNASKAKRRILLWHRYIKATGSMPTKKGQGGYHRGHALAYWNYMYAGRYAPIGVRSQWIRLSERGDT